VSLVVFEWRERHGCNEPGRAQHDQSLNVGWRCQGNRQRLISQGAQEFDGHRMCSMAKN
jgi:hypothetical protein